MTRLGLRVAGAAVLAATLTSALAGPWSVWRAVPGVALLLLPPAALLALTVALLGPRLWRACAGAPDGERALALSLAAWLALGGAALVMRLVVDAPFGQAALAAELALAAAALWLAAAVARRLAPRWRRESAVGWVALNLGVELALIDSGFLVREHLTMHAALLAATLAALVIAAAALSAAFPRAAAGAALTLSAALAGGAWLAAPTPWAAAVASYSPHQRAIVAARRLSDADGDGWSAHFDGGDCDDHDASAYPLSQVGRDCLGWMGRAHKEAPEPVAGATRAHPPRVVLLITADALRCTLDGDPAGMELCPRLARLAAEGRARGDAHSNFATTARAMTALQTGELYANPARPVTHAFHLAGFFAAHGFHTAAVSTHRYELAEQGVGPSFDTLDRSLEPIAARATASTAAAVTTRARAELAGGAPLFLWLHYFDAHAPYVAVPGSPLASSRRAAYAAEVARVDAAIGALARSLSARRDADDVVLLVTADHGEALGERGAWGHGFELSEDALRVPMIVWSAGADHRAWARGRLPASTGEVAAYLAGLVVDAALPDEDATFARLPAPGDHQLALITPDGWKLHYHSTLAFASLTHGADPRDSAATEPARVAALGAQLAAHLAALRDVRDHELARLAAGTP